MLVVGLDEREHFGKGWGNLSFLHCDVHKYGSCHLNRSIESELTCKFRRRYIPIGRDDPTIHPFKIFRLHIVFIPLTEIKASDFIFWRRLFGQGDRSNFGKMTILRNYLRKINIGEKVSNCVRLLVMGSSFGSNFSAKFFPLSSIRTLKYGLRNFCR